jgi:hypothetical protein
VAGPWVDEAPGHGFVLLSYGRYSADSYFAGPGQVDGLSKPVARGSKQDITVPFPGGGFGTVTYNSNYVSQDVSLYGEVSLGKGFAFVLQLPMYKYITQDVASSPDPNQLVEKGVGDLVLGVKYQIPKIKALRGFAFGPQLYFTAPTGNQNGKGAYPDTIAQAPLPLPTGNGTADMEMRGSFGYDFYPVPVFMTAELGYHHHFNVAACDDGKGGENKVSFSDDLPWNIQVGATWAPKKKYFDHGTLIATLHGARSFENGDVPGEHGLPVKGSPYVQNCGQANNTSYLSFGGTLMLFPIKWVGVSYTVEHALLGVNTGYGLSQMVGIAAQW